MLNQVIQRDAAVFIGDRQGTETANIEVVS